MAPVWKNWCVDNETTDEIENYEPAELNTLLEHFFAKVNNKKGEDYEPESLKVMMASLDRHLENKGCTRSIVRDWEFRACLHGGGGPQVGEVTRLGGVTRLSI